MYSEMQTNNNEKWEKSENTAQIEWDSREIPKVKKRKTRNSPALKRFSKFTKPYCHMFYLWNTVECVFFSAADLSSCCFSILCEWVCVCVSFLSPLHDLHSNHANVKKHESRLRGVTFDSIFDIFFSGFSLSSQFSWYNSGCIIFYFNSRLGFFFWFSVFFSRFSFVLILTFQLSCFVCHSKFVWNAMSMV